MVNYVLSFCKITGASRIFSRNFYLPLLKPLTPKEALRTFRITGKWLLGAKIQHYIPVLLNHRKARSKKVKNYGKKVHKESEDYTYMTPVLDSENESHQLLISILESKKCKKNNFVYTVKDKKYNIVLQAQLERAILDGDVIDVLVSQRNDKMIVKLKSMKKIPIEIQYYDGEDDTKLICGEGATCPEDEKFHHHGQYTMSLARMFEEKELVDEKWEEELRRIMRRRRRQAKEGSKDWKAMMQESIKNLDWQKFEEDAKKVIEEIDEPALEDDIDMEIDNLETTKNVNETLLKKGPEMLDQLPTMTEIPDIIKNMGSATLHEIETEEDDILMKRRVSGVKVTLPSGKECFVSGQMVHTEDGDVFVPGQTIENENGLEYAPGITIIIDNKPTLISGLIMGEEERDPMFLPTQSTITADGQLTFAATPEERPQVTPEKLEKKKLKMKMLQQEEAIEEETPEEIIIDYVSDTETYSSVEEKTDVSSIELNTSDIEEFDAEAERMKQEQQRLEIEQLKLFLMDDGLDDVIASIEEKRKQLRQKLEELRKLTMTQEQSLVSYITDSDSLEIASKISQDKETINRVSEILMTLTRRAATFRDRNSINADNINLAYISVRNLSDSDMKFNSSRNKLKIMLKTAIVAANDVFKTRPQDQVLALNSIAEIVVDVLKNDVNTLADLLDMMQTPKERTEICNAIFKQLVQNISDTKISFLNEIANNSSAYDVIEGVEKVLKKNSETKCEAFVKIAKVDPEIINLLVKNVKRGVIGVKTEEDAIELLEESIVESCRSLTKTNLSLLKDTSGLLEDAVTFAKALGMGKVEEILSEASTIEKVCDNRAVELLERTLLLRQLAERDFSLKSALDRIRKNPERGRSDPRIRQLIRESGTLMAKGPTLKNSRDIPIQMLKTQNLLAIEDLLVQKTKIEFPVMVSRDDLQAIIPKEAARGVLAGRVPYVLINESGVMSINPTRRFSTDDFSSVREFSVEKEDDRKYLQAKSNVRKLKKLLHSNSRQLA